jgi:Tfp pilus assembly PilM family ATPase
MPLYVPKCRILGVDIGSRAIKAVQLTTSLTDFQITGFMVKEHEVSTWDELSEVLRTLAEEGMEGDVVVTSFPSHRVILRTTEMPFAQVNKIDATIRFEAESIMAVPLDDMIVDFALLERRPHASTVLITCAEKELVQDYLDALHKADIKPDTIDIDSLALAHLMKELKEERNIALIDCGAEKASVDIFHKGDLRFTRSISIESGAKVGWKQIRPVLDEVILSIKAYLGMQEVQQIDEIWLMGGNSRVTRTTDYLEKGIGAVVKYPDVMGRFSSTVEVSDAMNLVGGVALGLALRGLHREKGRVDLARKVPGPAQTLPLMLRKKIVRVGVAAGILVALLAASFFVGVAAKERRYTVLKDEMQRVFQEAFPAGKGRAGNELQQAQALVKSMGARGLQYTANSENTPLTILREIAQLLPQGTKIVELDIAEGRVTLRGMAPSFAVVDEVKGAFGSSKLFQKVNVGNVGLARRGEQGVIFQMVFAVKGK